MKKRVFLFGILFLILVSPLIFAADNDTELSESQKVSQAYECLEDKIDEKDCKNLGFEEKVFAVLAVGECEDELLDDSKSEKCWPESGCTIKATAQAILALEKAGEDTRDAEDWLLEQKASPSELTWYLQIESPEETKCKISYDNKDYEITISKEKQLSASAGSCLSLSEGKWWLRVAPSCYGEEFEISCNQKFLTNLLFKEQNSQTIHVSEKTTESSANGVNTEVVNSFCFGLNSKCDYEGSLWATMALKILDNDMSDYLPYLITLSEKEENEKFIPESFLYGLTDSSDFRVSLLQKQLAEKYWDESGDRYYDTAVALLPIQDDTEEKINSKKWLLDNKTRDSEGCWKGSISATGFILYSIWGGRARSDGGSGGPSIDCEDKSGFCISDIDCSEAEGTDMNYECSGAWDICCSKNRILKTCYEQGGEICGSDEICQVGTTEDASDVVSGQTCCIQGECYQEAEESECAAAGGTCKQGCSEEEEDLGKSCEIYGDFCCVEKEAAPNKLLWVWILSLGILIVLVILGYFYKDKLRAYWVASTGKGKPSPPSRGGPFLPPSSHSFPSRGIPPRRIIPSSGAPARRPMPAKPSGEMEDVLKKLKEMGK